MSRSTLNQEQNFENNLQIWIDENGIDQQQKINRETAADRIRKCYHQRKEVLVLAELNLTSLPASIENLPWLRILSVGSNQLKSLPESITELRELRELYVDDNQLTSLPASIENLPWLRILSVGSNQLTSLPASIGNINNLERLFLHNNSLERLPESIIQLRELRELSVSGNQLTSLPASIGNINNLERLFLHNNALECLPKSIGNLRCLQYLSLEDNQLTRLPLSMISLNNLLYISVGNQRHGAPESLCRISNPDKMREYLGFEIEAGAKLAALAQLTDNKPNRLPSELVDEIFSYFYRMPKGDLKVLGYIESVRKETDETELNIKKTSEALLANVDIIALVDRNSDFPEVVKQIDSNRQNLDDKQKFIIEIPHFREYLIELIEEKYNDRKAQDEEVKSEGGEEEIKTEVHLTQQSEDRTLQSPSNSTLPHEAELLDQKVKGDKDLEH